MQFQAILNDILSEAKLTKGGIKKILKQMKINVSTDPDFEMHADSVVFWDPDFGKADPRAQRFSTLLAKAYPGVKIRTQETSNKTTVFWKLAPESVNR